MDRKAKIVSKEARIAALNAGYTVKRDQLPDTKPKGFHPPGMTDDFMDSLYYGIEHYNALRRAERSVEGNWDGPITMHYDEVTHISLDDVKQMHKRADDLGMFEPSEPWIRSTYEPDPPRDSWVYDEKSDGSIFDNIRNSPLYKAWREANDPLENFAKARAASRDPLEFAREYMQSPSVEKSEKDYLFRTRPANSVRMMHLCDCAKGSKCAKCGGKGFTKIY